MTLNEIKAMTCETLTPLQVSKLLKCDPKWIRINARENPAALGYPVTLSGNRVKIPRRAFIRFVEGGG